jgi:hypothetical protein
MVGGVLAVCLASSAFANSHYWTVNFGSKVTCDNYSAPNSGTHKVISHIHNNGNAHNTYDIQLVHVKNNWPDEFLKKYTQGCNVNKTSTWLSCDAGTYHWDMYKASGGANFTGSGTNYWP